MSEVLTSEKQRVRARVRASRRSRSPEAIAEAGRALAGRLAEVVTAHDAQSVACYLALPDEPQTADFLHWALDRGLRVMIPASRADGLLDWVQLTVNETSEPQAFTPAAFGISEPLGERHPPRSLTSVDLVFAPACAVDLAGVRLGWGRGYFDRTLALAAPTAPVYAVVFDDEVCEELPREPHDVPVTGAVTPSQILTGW